ncbi:MAG TPA: S8 family serine peptidase [Thermoanaerobaculia bacterium]|nr:S8 family serine peptidase [Thermoanaerobaculia bacterium]HUM29268.1 S8 family serine peptidase [Thermoanaerobaculia bacterium]HXK67774.1 S8 family serine peptidase [Thermoanaerobaculia bacterium]
MKKLGAALVLWALLVAVTALAVPAERAIVRPFDSSMKGKIAQTFGLNVIDDYGAFLLVEDSTGKLNSPQLLKQATVMPLQDWDVIRLTPNISIGSRAPILEATQAGLYVVHFQGPIKAEWVTALKARGVAKIVQYIPNFALLVEVPEGKPVNFGTIPAVDWAGYYSGEFKVSSHIRKNKDVKEGDAAILLLNNNKLSKTLQDLTSLGVTFTTPRVTTSPFVYLTAHGRMEMVERVVKLPYVIWIEPIFPREMHDEIQDQILAGNYTGTLPDGPGYEAWLSTVGLSDVSSVIVDVADDGWDTGDTTVGNHHPDFDDALGTSCRVIYQVDLCSEGNFGMDGHGTINQSIVLGDGKGTGALDGNNYYYGMGMAPTARGGQTKIFGSSGWCGMADMFEITAPAASNGAVITSNSWGASTYGGYNIDAQQYDLAVRDADGNSGNGLYAYTVVFSAGNDGPTDGMTGAPGTAKNVITSGASENVRDHGIADGCGDSNADSLNDITDFTSPGPCEDGRIKPDAMAPGNHIQGAASQYSGFTGASVCGASGTADDRYWPSGQTFYTWSSGTSHSCPSMAGAAALIYQYYDNEMGTPPSPAMNKAVMLGSADDMVGGADGNGSSTLNFPNMRQGWGRVNLGRAFDSAFKYYFDQGYTFTTSGQTHSPEPIFSVVDPSLPVRVMLVYSDAPGDPNATPSGGLVNDLDLEVTVGADVYLGNNFTNGVSVPNTGTPDTINNVEGVYFPAGVVATFTLRVIATNLGGDAIPGDANLTDQDYALYIYNATNQTSAGIIQMDREIYNCSDTIEVTVSDADLQGAGTQDVLVSSTTEPAGETLTLNEVGTSSGVFTGMINTTSVAPASDGLLSVTNGDTITATYNDADSGSSTQTLRAPAIVTDTAVADCVGPIISNVQIISITHNSAIVTWDTNEPATSLVNYGDTPGLGNTASSPALVLNHSILLTNLLSCTTYFVEVSSTDAAQNTVTDNNSGAYYTFETLGMFDFFMDDVESGNAGWTADSPWAIIDTDSHSASHSWTDSPGGNYTAYADVSLTSPVFNFSAYSTALLSFWHHYDIESGYDYGYVEVTTNGGTSWTAVATYSGTLAAWTQVAIDLSAYAGNPAVQFRFHLVADDIVNRDGWYVDDVIVSVPVNCHAGMIMLDRDVYTCSGDTIAVTVMDMDLNTNPGVQETVNVTLSSTTEAGGETVTLTEQSTSSSVFLGSIATTAGAPAADGLLSLTDGDTITGTYNDADDGSGNPAVVTDTASAFCTPLTISNVQAVVNGNSVTVTWTTNRDADSLVTYDPSMPPASTASDPTLVSSHSVTIPGLLVCTDYYFSVTSVDTYGISASDDNSGTYYTFTAGTLSTAIYNSTDTPLSIPDSNPTGVTSTISVPDAGTVVDVNVTLTITHTWDSDLDIYLVAPNGTQVELSTDNGSSGDNYTNTVFDDEAATAITAGTAPFTGSFIPEAPLSQVDGISALGDWDLFVADDAGGDTGTIQSWSLTIEYPPMACGPEASYDSHSFTDDCTGGGPGDGDGFADPGENLYLTVTLANSGTDPVTGVSAVLSSATPGITVNVDTSPYPDLGVGATGTNTVLYEVTIDQAFPCGDPINFQIDITTNEGSWTDTFQQTTGMAGGGQLLYEQFETWPPAGWQNINNGGCGAWDTTANTGGYSGLGNTTGGTGEAADANSDDCGSAMNTALITPSIDLTSVTGATLQYNCRFEDYAGDGDAYTDISTNGGSSWTNLRSETTDDGGGHLVNIDLTPYVGNNVLIRFRYVCTGWAWGWMVDGVEVTATGGSATCTTCVAGGCDADLGDVNLNSQVTALDASLVLQEVVGMITFTPEEYCRANVNQNAAVTSLDAAYILMCVAGNCPGLPAGFEPSCNAHGNCLP